jgi:hypothetical protein
MVPAESYSPTREPPSYRKLVVWLLALSVVLASMLDALLVLPANRHDAGERN